ncbi:hypothetical protein [Aliivibrio fischeri]|uniref:hypothetical protein n=1 Tax=Aliivibrio fischeri TaxID=668 RepID=UPI001F28DAEB|nr:hypothetical protein [Aliivibrio fischeri]MCE7556357.1 hypothetical protein [Aliivibrio fischeri]MCE7563080.1 hypothetical protein [Aliivibrio fischeri]MCE7571372.1 hypothetical protein [Aliivibrio fischeri]
MANKADTIQNVESFIQILEQHGVIKSSTPLHELIKELNKTRIDKGLRYQLIGLDFLKLSNKQFINNEKWDANGFRVQLHLNLSLNPNNVFEFGAVNNSVVEIMYEAHSEDTCELARGAWHLDYHKDELDTAPEFIHPSYHFHHGGRRIKEETENYGELVLLDAPRLMHPPLDLFLAIDLLVSNFLEKRAWRNLRADTAYQEIIKLSQIKWWQEYYQQVADYWSHQTSGAGDIAKRDIARLSNPYLY